MSLRASGWGSRALNRQLFEILARKGWLPAALAHQLRDMAGFRNVLVHGYAAVDPRIVRDVVENRLGDLLAFVAEMRRRLAQG